MTQGIQEYSLTKKPQVENLVSGCVLGTIYINVKGGDEVLKTFYIYIIHVGYQDTPSWKLL
jgi:hypothetical protein